MNTFSILIPVYNVENYVLKCLDSIRSQIFQDYELIIVDDASPDKSMTIVNEYLNSHYDLMQKTKIVRHEQNRGLAAARLSGLQEATGNYIVFVDSDDWLELNFLNVFVEIIEKESPDIVMCNVNHIWKDKTTIEYSNSITNREEYIASILERRNTLNVWGKAYKRDLFHKLKPGFIEGINFGEDYVVLSRIVFFAHNIYFLKETLYNYSHLNENSYTYKLKRQSVDNLIAAEAIVNKFYTDKGLYADSLKVGRLKIKSELLISYFRSSGKDIVLLSYLDCLYKKDQQQIIFVKNLSLANKFVLLLCELKLYGILRLYVRVGSNIKQILK